MNPVPLLLLPLLLLPSAALLAPVVQRMNERGAVVLASGATGLSLALVLVLTPGLGGGQALTVALPWVPALGLEVALRLDGLALCFALLVLGIGLLVTLYARYYLPAGAPRGRFHALMLAFQAAMLGLVLADNLLWLVLCWELTSLASFLLIAFDSHSRGARRGAALALVVTAAGGLALLAGVLLLGHAAGSLRIGDVLNAGAAVRAHPLHGVMLALILLGVFTKSAQFPFHAWLPAAMAAPTPVSAYLHSATMVKAGVFLLARFWPIFSPGEAWFPLVGGVGLATFVFGAYVALFKHDLKGLLAYSTISHLGLIVFLFGLGTPLAAVAGLFHTLNHAVFKASLFMAAGIIDHETGTRDMRRLGGLYRCMPVTGTLALVAAGAMAGVPLLNGFVSKEMFFAEAADPPVASNWPGVLKAALHGLLPAAAVLGGIFSVAYSVRFGHDVFFRRPPPAGLCPPQEPSWWMRLPVATLVVVCVLVGIFPEVTMHGLLAAGSHSMLSAVPDFHLELWRGVTPALVMSAMALAGGALVYGLRGPLFRWHDQRFTARHAATLYLRLADRLTVRARQALIAFGPASLPRSAAWLFGTATVMAALGWGLAGSPWLPVDDGVAAAEVSATTARDWRTPLPLDLPSLAAGVVVLVGVRGMVRRPELRLQAVLYSGAVGLVVSLAFVHFSAPDLALTQIAVELVTTLLLLAVLGLLPGADMGMGGPVGSAPTPSSRVELGIRKAANRGSAAADRPPAPALVDRRVARTIAVAAGIGSAALAAVVLLRPQAGIADFYLAQAEPAAHARNVVNAILTDFRALDTLGEITVLGMAGLAVHLLFAGRSNPPPARAPGPLLLRVLSLLVLPAALLLAVFLLLRGHQAPGGGFVAGLVLATALVVEQLAWGVPEPGRRLPAVALIGAGLVLAWLTALAPMLLGDAPLASLLGDMRLPVVGHLVLGSTLVFDTGVLLVVAGSILAACQRLGEQPAAADADPAANGGS
jgi:multicomponent K+:H+ antiporter subunit A